MRSLLVLAAALALAASPHAQIGATPKHEFRAAWIATVANLDWPNTPGASVAQQKAELTTMLDRLQAVGINAVLFQVRSESDAMYASPYEPWSYSLTGEQGRDPGWDPLAFAVDEAHKRGMELHAWFNPYRADRDGPTSGYTQAASHVTRVHPEWVLTYPSGIRILDPGQQAVRTYITRVIADVARRYDIDGVHFDDYFYPYEGTTNQDAATFAANNEGFSDVANWRRFNIFRFVRQVRDSLAAVKPEIAYGISPFGIWRSGVPTGISGMDAYSQIYADAVGWLDNRLLDYLTPQLYWAFGGGQDYAKLAPWWASQMNGRHLYPGHGLYRAEDATRGTAALFAAREVPRQVRFNRATPGILGSVFFRAKNLTVYPTQGFADSLRTRLYRFPALPPPMVWKSQAAPGPPTALTATSASSGAAVTLSWTAPTAGAAPARFYAVYRFLGGPAIPPDFSNARNLVGITGETTFTDRRDAAGDMVQYAVTAVSANSIESGPTDLVLATGPLAGEDGAALARRFALGAPAPNPVAGETQLDLALEAPAAVTVRVLSVTGREVAVLVRDRRLAAGTHTLTWRPRDVAAGTYFVMVEAGGQRATRAVTVTR